MDDVGVVGALVACAATGAMELAIDVCGAAGVAVEPEIAAGAASPPAVARLATMPSTTDPLPGALVADATTAWPRGVVETWVISWSPVCTGMPAIVEAADEPVVPAPEARAWAPASRAG